MDRPGCEFHWLPLLLACVVGGPLTILAATVPPAAAETPGIELHFDDGPDNTDDSVYPLRNAASEGSDNAPFPASGPQLDITFLGFATRSSILAGKYGRAAELTGGSDAIHVTDLYTGFDTPDLYAWWSLDNRTSGIFWKENCRFEVGLAPSRKLYVKVFPANCGTPTTATTDTLEWPDDPGWYQLTIHRYVAATVQRFDLSIGFEPPETVNTPPIPQDPPTDIWFGLGIDGRVDKLKAADFAPGQAAFFDYDPDHCGTADPNAACWEDDALAIDGDLLEFGWDVEVRYKVVYDDQVCIPTAAPCKVVFMLSGGGSCADDYPETDNVLDAIIDRGLAVVAVDPICWAHPDFDSYPDEITQILAVKAAIDTDPLLDFSGGYYASGCSHGAHQVLEWAVENAALPQGDRPQRIFVRSTGLGEHDDCVYHEQWCGAKQELYDEVLFSLEFGRVCHEVNWNPHSHLDEESCPDNWLVSRRANI